MIFVSSVFRNLQNSSHKKKVLQNLECSGNVVSLRIKLNMSPSKLNKWVNKVAFSSMTQMAHVRLAGIAGKILGTMHDSPPKHLSCFMDDISTFIYQCTLSCFMDFQWDCNWEFLRWVNIPHNLTCTATLNLHPPLVYLVCVFRKGIAGGWSLREEKLEAQLNKKDIAYFRWILHNTAWKE